MFAYFFPSLTYSFITWAKQTLAVLKCKTIVLTCYTTRRYKANKDAFKVNGGYTKSYAFQ